MLLLEVNGLTNGDEARRKACSGYTKMRSAASEVASDSLSRTCRWPTMLDSRDVVSSSLAAYYPG